MELAGLCSDNCGGGSGGVLYSGGGGYRLNNSNTEKITDMKQFLVSQPVPSEGGGDVWGKILEGLGGILGGSSRSAPVREPAQQNNDNTLMIIAAVVVGILILK